MRLPGADFLLMDKPTNDLGIPALEVLEDSLEEFPGALVIVSHDRDLTDRLCTAVVGLDGCGGFAIHGSVGQWLAAYEPPAAERGARGEDGSRAPRAAPPPPQKKLSFREQQEWGGMAAAITVAEEAAVERQAAVERAATAGHAALAAACRELEAAQHAVERLYARWRELEAKRG